MTPAFIWCDIETTGLDRDLDDILALGLVLTDAEFRVIDQREWVIGVPQSSLDRMNDFVLKMHTTSGLLDRVRASEFDIDTVEVIACAFLDAYLGEPAEAPRDRPPMAGNSVHFDRGFLDSAMPTLMKRFNYRHLDVSSLKVLAMATVPGARAWNDSRPHAAHTPLADLEGSIAELQHWRAVISGERVNQ